MAIGDALTGFLTGATGGFQFGTDVRRQRTSDKERRVDTVRRRVGEDLTAANTAEDRVIAAEDRAQAQADAERARFFQGARDQEEFPDLRFTGETQQELPQEVLGLRNRIGQGVVNQANQAFAPEQPPAGFEFTGEPSRAESEEQARIVRAQGVAAVLDPEAPGTIASRLSDRPGVIADLQETQNFNQVLALGGRGAGASTRLQRFTSGGKEFIFDPDTGDVSEATFEDQEITSGERDRDAAQGRALDNIEDDIRRARNRAEEFSVSDDPAAEIQAAADQAAFDNGLRDEADFISRRQERNRDLFAGTEAVGDGGFDDVVLSLEGRSEAEIRALLPQVIEGGVRKYSDDDIDQIVAAVTGGR